MELYVHIPFCRQKCRYCDFASFSGMESRMEAYIRALLQEAEIRSRDVEEPIITVYFGGGTPSLLPPDLLTTLINGLRRILPINHVTEWTAEANPGTLTGRWLESAARGGVNRVSLGMQAAQDSLLRMLGRIHRLDQVTDSVRLIRAWGIQNISLDLMFGLPGQSLEDWQETLDAALSLSPQHISAYGLIPEEGTPLYQDLESGLLTLPETETEREMYDLLLQTTAAAGFEQYEISNFSRPGFICRHNIGYWDLTPYLGLGLSAASMLGVHRSRDGIRYIRQTNVSGMDAYLSGIENKAPNLSEHSEITEKEARFETMMLGLRMNDGVSEARFLSLHGHSLESCYGNKLRTLQTRGLVQYDTVPGRWRLTRLGMDLQNQVLVDLMDD